MEEWTTTLQELDTPKNHKRLFNKMFEAYLTSEYANDAHERTKAVMLFRHIKTLFKRKGSS